MAIKFKDREEAREHARQFRVALANLANEYESYDMEDLAGTVWQAWDQAGDVIEELEEPV